MNLIEELMRVKSNKAVTFTALVFGASQAMAGPQYIDQKIDNVRVRENIAYLKIESCTKYSRINLTDTYGKAMYATAMLALALDKPISIEMKKSNGCTGAESELEYVDLAS